MTKNHNNFLNFAFHIAEKNLGKTKLNPSVGSVVVKNGEVISSAITSLNGRPHSEFNALNNLKNCSGATLYTTLEPCTHKGKTPPCVSIIIKKNTMGLHPNILQSNFAFLYKNLSIFWPIIVIIYNQTTEYLSSFHTIHR